MKLRKEQSGFSIVELVIILAVIGILGFVGYNVYNKDQDNQTASNSSSEQIAEQSPTATDVQSAPDVNSTSDLDNAEAMLDTTDPSSSSDSAELDTLTTAF